MLPYIFKPILPFRNLGWFFIFFFIVDSEDRDLKYIVDF
jgi:hypothetical protein